MYSKTYIMCGDSKRVFTVTLDSKDRHIGADPDQYTVTFPDQIPAGKYKCHVRVTITSSNTMSALNMRSPVFTGMNYLSSGRKGYVAALVYTDKVPAEGTLIMDGVPSEIEIAHTNASSGAFRNDCEEHLIQMTLVEL